MVEECQMALVEEQSHEPCLGGKDWELLEEASRACMSWCNPAVAQLTRCRRFCILAAEMLGWQTALNISAGLPEGRC